MRATPERARRPRRRGQVGGGAEERADGARLAKHGRAWSQTFFRAASIALGDSAELRPGRKLPWWRRPHTR